MKHSTNYKFNLPTYKDNELADIGVISQNFEKIDEVMKKNEDLGTELNKFEAETMDAIGRLNTKDEELQSQIDNLGGVDLSELQSQIDTANTDIVEIQESVHNLDMELGLTKSDLHKVEARVGSWDGSGNLYDMVKAAKTDISALKTKDTDLQSQIDNLGGVDVSELQTDINHLQEKVDVMNGDIGDWTGSDTVYQAVTKLKGDLNKLNDGGLNLKDEIIEEDINNWLNEHPEATTTVQNGSLSYKSFIFGELPFVTPEYFGAVGDGVTDDTNAIKQALSCSLPSNGYILFSPKTYCVSSVLDIANKNIIFNNCTLKRIANCTVVKFDEAKNFVLSDLHIEDDGNTYGIMVVGNHCENVEIRNVSICSNSPHTDTSAGNWATSLSGDRFHIKGLYINNYKSGLWADGLHFAYVSNSVIEDFVIISGDDSISITQHEKGGTIFSNTLSENVRFVNGVLKSGNASAVRLGFDNSGVRKTEEISNCYHKNITFENIDCKTKYFIRIEYLPHGSDAVPVSDENINFYNVSFAPLGDVSAYPFFYATKEYELKRWKFKDCKILCDIVTDEMTQSFFHTNCDNTNNDSKMVFDTCEFDFGCINGFTGNYMKKLLFVGCDLRTNGKVIASIYGAYEFVNCNIINYGETEVDYVCTSHTTDSLKVHKVNGCVIDKFKQFCNVNDDGQTKLYINDCIYNTDSNIMNWYSGNANYNNVVKGTRRLISSEDMFVYVPANGSISYDVSGCSYIKIRPLLHLVYTYDVVIRTLDNAIMSSKEKISEIKQMFTDSGLEVSIENSKVTLTNLTDTFKNVFIKFYSQTN